MADEIVDVNIKIEESKLATLSMTVTSLGGQMSVQKQMKFKDLGLAEVEKGNFQCLVCSKMIKRKDHAIRHFKKIHTDQTELTCQCPRCDLEMPKSKLNQHMDQVHDIKMFNQLIKRSFQPDTPTSNFPMKICRPFLESDPLTLSQEYLNNNDVKTEQSSVQELEEEIESEKFVSDFEINYDIKTELADEGKILPSPEMTVELNDTSMKPDLKVRKD